MHDELEEKTTAVLAKLEASLDACYKRQALEDASLIEEVRGLKQAIENPPVTLALWAEEVN